MSKKRVPVTEAGFTGQGEHPGIERFFHKFQRDSRNDENHEWNSKAEVKRVPLGGKVYSMQPHLWKEPLDAYREDRHGPTLADRVFGHDPEDTYAGGKHPMMVHHQGDHYVFDGHHRVGADLLDGRTDTEASVWDADTHGLPGHRTAAREPGSEKCWVCAGTADDNAGGECEFCDGSGYLTPSEQKAATCPCGKRVTRRADGGDWLTHLDGSLSHDSGENVPKAADGHYMSVAEVMRHTASEFRPTQRIFGKTFGLDHRLFADGLLKGDVRDYILNTLDVFWSPRYGSGWRDWSMVYFAGSEASEWTSETLEGNNDFDVLIGVDYDVFRAMYGVDASNEEITSHFNDEFRKELNPLTNAAAIMVDGVPQGPFDNTWYVNKDSYDIRAIRPYAAYNVTKNEWAVRPPHLDSWDLSQFPEGQALTDYCSAVSDAVRAVLGLPEPYKTQQAVAWWDHLHGDRSRAFTPQGEGWFDPANVVEKWLDQEGLWEQLGDAKRHADTDPHALDAPSDWSNDPIARAAFLLRSTG